MKYFIYLKNLCSFGIVMSFNLAISSLYLQCCDMFRRRTTKHLSKLTQLKDNMRSNELTISLRTAQVRRLPNLYISFQSMNMTFIDLGIPGIYVSPFLKLIIMPMCCKLDAFASVNLCFKFSLLNT